MRFSISETHIIYTKFHCWSIIRICILNERTQAKRNCQIACYNVYCRLCFFAASLVNLDQTITLCFLHFNAVMLNATEFSHFTFYHSVCSRRVSKAQNVYTLCAFKVDVGTHTIHTQTLSKAQKTNLKFG